MRPLSYLSLALTLAPSLGGKTFAALSSGGTSFSTSRTVLSSAGTPYVVPGAVLSSGGVSYNAI